MSEENDPWARAREAAEHLERTAGARHDVAVVLGSGWAGAQHGLGERVAEVPASQVPGFGRAGVPGHEGTVSSVRLPDGRRVLVLAGRVHLYEGLGVRAVVHGVRTAAATGCRVIVLTNGCGGLDPAWVPGTPVLIEDHLNLTGVSPVEGPRFVDLTDLYAARLRATCREVRPDLPQGVYVQFRGPHYETPAEVRMAGRLGGHLVGMSTALEAIAAREAGMEVLGISLVTNHAAGVSERPLDHAEVVRAGQEALPRLAGLLAEVLPRL